MLYSRNLVKLWYPHARLWAIDKLGYLVEKSYNEIKQWYMYQWELDLYYDLWYASDKKISPSLAERDTARQQLCKAFWRDIPDHYTDQAWLNQWEDDDMRETAELLAMHRE